MKKFTLMILIVSTVFLLACTTTPTSSPQQTTAQNEVVLQDGSLKLSISPVEDTVVPDEFVVNVLSVPQRGQELRLYLLPVRLQEGQNPFENPNNLMESFALKPQQLTLDVSSIEPGEYTLSLAVSSPLGESSGWVAQASQTIIVN